MQWLEITVETEAAAVETVSAVLHEHGEGGVAVYQTVIPDDEDAAYHYDTSLPTRVTTYVLDTADGAARRARIEEALGHLTVFNLAKIGPVEVKVVDEEDWANAWKRYYNPMRFGSRIVVKPSWRTFEADLNDLVIELDPGMAFGTGLHQTTALCLALLEDYIKPGDVVLDQGTGSGILALGAVLLGAAHVTGVDNSEVAVIAANENAVRNGAADRITAIDGETVPDPPAKANGEPGIYDVVIANIIAVVIMALAPEFARVLKPEGILIASGIIKERENEVRDALDTLGFVVERREGRDEWIALVARRA